MNEMSDLPKHVGDALSISVVLGTLAHLLPSIAAVLTIAWTLIRIYETKTFKRIFNLKQRD